MITAVELESGIGGDQDWEVKTESQLIESRSRGASIALEDEYLIVVCLTSRQH